MPDDLPEKKFHRLKGPSPRGPRTLRKGTTASEMLVPLAVLVGMGIGASALVFILSGGAEIADDASHLFFLARHPLVLWGDHSAAGLNPNWGSLPPLLPILFGMLVAPWAVALPDFWAIRMGVLSWTAVTAVILWLLLRRSESPPRPGIPSSAGSPQSAGIQSRSGRRTLLVLFALAPSVWGAIGMIPQEEIYVSVFVLALYWLASSGRWGMVWIAFVAAALAAKYFLLVLAIPLALLSPRPLKNFIVWTAVPLLLLVPYVIYHRILFGQTPILGHAIDPGSSISLWALAWDLGFRASPHVINGASVVLAGVVSSIFAWKGRGRMPLAFMMAGVLYITLLTVSITFPAYVLWVVPLTFICVYRMERKVHRVGAVALLFAWGAAEWGENLFRGVAMALSTERSPGKERLASAARDLLGTGFPFFTVQVLCTFMVILCGIMMLVIIWKSGISASHSLREPAAEKSNMI